MAVRNLALFTYVQDQKLMVAKHSSTMAITIAHERSELTTWQSHIHSTVYRVG